MVAKKMSRGQKKEKKSTSKKEEEEEEEEDEEEERPEHERPRWTTITAEPTAEATSLLNCVRCRGSGTRGGWNARFSRTSNETRGWSVGRFPL